MPAHGLRPVVWAPWLVIVPQWSGATLQASLFCR